MFRNAISFNGQLKDWDTAKVTNMAMLFNGATLFNQPIGSWDTAQVTTMEGMFLGARTFNQPLANWNVQKMQNFDEMSSKRQALIILSPRGKQIRPYQCLICFLKLMPLINHSTRGTLLEYCGWIICF